MGTNGYFEYEISNELNAPNVHIQVATMLIRLCRRSYLVVQGRLFLSIYCRIHTNVIKSFDKLSESLFYRSI